MYNKLFTKILDSSIWLESTPTRIVWLTFIAVMDESGFAQFASVANVAHRARVTLEEAQAAITAFEGPDPDSSDPENNGQRLERVPGGWIVLNAEKHRAMVTRALIQEQTRERVRRHRAKKRNSNALVTPSEADTRAESETTAVAGEELSSADADFEAFRRAYPVSRRVGGNAAIRAYVRARKKASQTVLLAALERQKQSDQWQTPKLVPLMTTWLNQERWLQELPSAGAMVSPQGQSNAAVMARVAERIAGRR